MTETGTISWSQARDRVATLVGKRITALQADYRSDTASRSSRASATLARLRRAFGSKPGESPELWQITEIDEESLGPQRGSDPTRVEWAVHVALTMYALHQQSRRSDDMHARGHGLGSAVARLQREASSAEAVHRRFTAAGSAVDLAELTNHLKGLVTQMRQHRIPLDYGRLAADLFAWQHPTAAGAVRRAWGRDLYAATQRLDRKGNETDREESP